MDAWEFDPAKHDGGLPRVTSDEGYLHVRVEGTDNTASPRARSWGLYADDAKRDRLLTELFALIALRPHVAEFRVFVYRVPVQLVRLYDGYMQAPYYDDWFMCGLLSDRMSDERGEGLGFADPVAAAAYNQIVEILKEESLSPSRGRPA